jgi:uncharacterized protein with HEPN domain
MKKFSIVYVEDIIEAIGLVETYVKNTSEVQFSRNTQLQDAVIRRLVIIGEAANKIPGEARGLAPAIPWRTIVGFRNVAIHDYASVKMGRVWEITQTELPILKKEIASLRTKLLAPPNNE